MSSNIPDERLRRLYALALSRRSGAPQDISVETVHALATGTYTQGDRLTRLEEVLANPSLAAEFDFFADLERESRGGMAARRWSFPRALPLAAGVALLLGAGLVWRAMRPAEDVMRGSDAVVTAAPLAGETISPGSLFAWRAVPTAVHYRLRLIDRDGAERFSRETTDTSLILPADLSLPRGADFTWWVTASLLDGRALRSSAIRVRSAPE